MEKLGSSAESIEARWGFVISQAAFFLYLQSAARPPLCLLLAFTQLALSGHTQTRDNNSRQAKKARAARKMVSFKQEHSAGIYLFMVQEDDDYNTNDDDQTCGELSSFFLSSPLSLPGRFKRTRLVSLALSYPQREPQRTPKATSVNFVVNSSRGSSYFRVVRKRRFIFPSLPLLFSRGRPTFWEVEASSPRG